jgi:hypothetical protein
MERDIGYDVSRVAKLRDAAKYLSDHNLPYAYTSTLPSESALRTILAHGSSILEYSQMPGDLGHAVVVDEIKEGGFVSIRDPNPQIGAIKYHVKEVLKRWDGNAITHRDAIEVLNKERINTLDISILDR